MTHNIQYSKMLLFLGVFSIIMLLFMAAECDIPDKGKPDMVTIAPAQIGNSAEIYNTKKDADDKIIAYKLTQNKKFIFEGKAKNSKGTISYTIEKYSASNNKFEVTEKADAVVTNKGEVTIKTKGYYYLIATALPDGEYKSADAKALLVAGRPDAIVLAGRWEKPDHGTLSKVTGNGLVNSIVTSAVVFSRKFTVTTKKDKFFPGITPVILYEGPIEITKNTAEKTHVELIPDGTKNFAHTNRTGVVSPISSVGGLVKAKVQFPYTLGSISPNYTAKKR